MKFRNQLTAAAFATLALTAGTGAFASELDGVADNAWLEQTNISQQAPVPSAASADAKDANLNTQAVTP